jgi:undecaprenyl-diphosphatase
MREMLAWIGRRRRPEARVLLGALCVVASLFAFSRIADEMAEGDTGSFDRAILLSLRDPADLADPIGPPWFEEMARDVTGLGGTFVLTLVTVLATGFLLTVGRRRSAILVLVTVGGGTLLSYLLKGLFERARPDIVPHLAQVYTASFPSSHAMLSAVTYPILGALLAQLQRRWSARIYVMGAALLMPLLIGLSRIYLGVHWPTDVAAGWCVGIAWALLCYMASLRWSDRAPGDGQAVTPGMEPGA